MSDATLALCALRGTTPRAVFAWEVADPLETQTPDGPQTQAVTGLLGPGGFALCATDPLRTPVAQAVNYAVRLEPDGEIAIIHLPSGARLFFGELPSPPAGWLEAARAEHCVLAVSGVELGLNGTDPAAALTAAAAAGQVVTAVVGVLTS